MQFKKDDKLEIKSTAHSRYRCQYHIVFAPKYRRKEIYGKLKKDIGEIIRKLCNQKNVEIIEAVIRAHFKMGGTLINVNVMDRKKILEAHKDPSLHPDLVVRVTGFTAYFSMLSPEFRQLVVDRILMD